MRVGISVRRFARRGGMERVAHGFAAWMAREGHDVDVWCNEFAPGTSPVSHRPLGAGGRGVAWKAYSLAAAVARIPTDDYDGFLHFERGGQSAVYRAGSGCHASYRARCGGGLAGPLIQSIDRRSCEAAVRVVVNSQMVATELQEFYDIDPGKLRLVRNGVDLERFSPGQRSPEPEVVFLGSDARRKGLQTAIRATAILPGVTLRVVGSVSTTARAMARAEGVSERVVFEGECDHPEHVLSSAHALVLPTHYDPSANAVLEALACGVPVVTSAANGAAEVLPERSIILQDPMDADHCAEVLATTMADPSLPAACRAAAESHGMHTSFGALFRAMIGEPC